MLKTPCGRSTEPDHRGFTLIEVLAATVLAGTLFAASLVGVRQHTRQLEAATDKRAAVEVLDELLTDWFARPRSRPSATQGRVPGRPLWRWSRSIVRPPSVEAPFAVVRIEVFLVGKTYLTSLASVEIVERAQ